MKVDAIELPKHAQLSLYATADGYTDCFACELPQQVDLGPFVAAFYTSWLFKLERAVLRLAGFRSSDADALALAHAKSDRFAAWTVEARSANQIMLAAQDGATRSWLMVEPIASGTRLMFGSAVIAKRQGADGKPAIGRIYQALIGVHVAYSRALLRAAAARLERRD
jgi:hypothetical protein